VHHGAHHGRHARDLGFEERPFLIGQGAQAARNRLLEHRIDRIRFRRADPDADVEHDLGLWNGNTGRQQKINKLHSK
jgi:hypothetical protein